ncbi:restriction endonuclease subunit S [Corallococcus carmarthensis]|uniref:Type I restriction modification DNA specificity domain-containing protein n=1 Tax=Corallococcus carmarthensis TaxID=2316728 RepID=A0A3A8JN66_9BACT|nr:restriction endonuclease subunit S [Corallococcus carmarthensis]RKG97232.1 hypothetical protein D7X32_33415 [Corallococcus carmarthensis]
MSTFDLPQGWAETTLGELGRWSSGGTPSRGNSAFYGGKIPWVKTGELQDGIITVTEENITEEGLGTSAAKVFPERTLLVAMYGATIGKIGILGTPAATNQACAALVAEGLTTDLIPFVFYYLRSCRDELRAAGQGGAQPNISQALLKAFPCRLPPHNEQRRIVAKLEALLARSRRAKEALDAIPTLLERFRQSVLAAAFRGDLTRDWREKNPDVEPASEFLARIRTERRHRWEEAELKRMRAKGKVPKDDQWKTKYEAPAQIDESGLQELPSGWAWASIEEVCPLEAPVVYGIILPGDDVKGGVPYIRPIDMNSDGTIDFTSMKRTSSSIAAQYKRASLRSGDIVLSIVGTIGKVIVVPEELEGGNITQSSARLRPPDWLSGDYLRLALLSPILRSQYDKFRFGNAVQRLNIEHVRRLAIPIAPSGEMKLMVTRAAAALACADKVQTVEQRQHLDKLEQSVLAKAFRGELVPQDPNDEPASVLIEGIRAQRETAEQEKLLAGSKRRREGNKVA